MSYEPKVQDIINELIEIKRRSARLNKRDVPRVKYLFVSLRKMGYSAKDMEQMTDGEWKEAAIKPYISRVSPEKDSTGPQAELGALAEMARRRLDFDMVTQANVIKKTLDDENVSLDNVSELIRDVRGAGMSIHDFVSIVKQVKTSDIPIVDLGKAFSYRKSLDAMGIDTRMLGKLIETISKQGSLEKTIELVSSLGPLEARKVELDGLKKTKETLQSTLNTMHSEIRELEDKKNAIQVALDLYEQLEKKGFNQDILVKIKESSEKYGEPAQVLEAINQYGSVANLTKEIVQMKSEANTIQENLTNLRDQYRHLLEVTAMCEELLKLKFNISAIRQIYDAAKQYGEPIEVLKAIDKYGRLPELEGEIAKLIRERDEANKTIEQLQEKLKDYNEIKRQRDEAQNNLTSLDERSIKLIDELGQELDKPPNVRTYRKELVDSGLSVRMEEIIERLVNKRVIAAQNNELIMIFQREVKKQLNEIFRIWPSRLARRTPEKEKKLQQKALANPFVALKGDWYIDCSTCGDMGPHTLRLHTTYDIQQLLTSNYVEVPAPDIIAYVKGAHSVRVTLADVIKLYLEKRE